MKTVEIINKSNNELPKYAKSGDAGMDIRADFKNIKSSLFHFADYDEKRNVVIIWPGGRALIGTGLYVAAPENHEFQIRPRSGMAIKHGITVLNTPGTIDAGYRNEIGVILVNLGDEIFEIEEGDRICQMVLNKFEQFSWKEVEELSDSERGKSGFGDSGVK